MWRRLLIGAGLVVVALYANWQLRAPSHDRDWAPLYARLAEVTAEDGLYRIANMRNWSYSPGGETEPDWMTVSIDPDMLIAAYLVVEPFGRLDAVAHTMLAFQFFDGSTYVASVEARRETGESYGGLRAGIVPMHEYMVVWATERDMYANSTFLTGDELYLYPLSLPLSAARDVLLAILDETASVAESPRWYNTFMSNCTNVLARAINDRSPGSVPWDISWYMPGYAARFLYDEGFMSNRQPFERAGLYLTPHVPEIAGIEDPRAFSQALRDRLGLFWTARPATSG